MPNFRDALKERAVRLFGGVTQKDAASRAYEAYGSGYNDGEDEPSSGDLAKFGYRRSLTSGLRDFTLVDYRQVLSIVWVLFQSNPLAKRYLNIKRDYVLGRGITPECKNPELKEILDGFWETNDMTKRQREFVLQLYLFGVQCYPAFVKKSDGKVRLGYVDPDQILDVITHPENSMEPWAVVVESSSPSKSWEESKGVRIYRIIRVEENEPFGRETENLGIYDPLSPNIYQPHEVGDNDIEDGTDEDIYWDAYWSYLGQRGKKRSYVGKLVTAEQANLEDWEEKMLQEYGLAEYSGSCFYFRVNTVSNNPFGFSDLLQVADWLDQHDVTLFSLADREQLASYFSWFVKVQGADPEDIKKRSMELRKRPPARGSVNVHSDAEEWAMQHPDIQATNSIETSRELRLQALGGLGIPEHWYGKGDETNRATAEAQGDPTWKTLQHSQGTIQGNFLLMLRFVRDQAEIAGFWVPGEKTIVDVELPMPEMTTSDMSETVNSASTLSGALVIAEEEGWQTKKDSRMIWAKAIAELGVELDTSLEVETEDREDEDQTEESLFLADSGSVSWSSLSERDKEIVAQAFLERVGVGGHVPDYLLDTIAKSRGK